MTHSNKTYLVTGGTTGIGAATVAYLAERGARVIATGRNPKTLEVAKASAPANTEIVASDAGKLEDIRALAAHIKAEYGTLDGVVLNAGIAAMNPLGAWDEESFDQLFTVNVKGPFFLLQALKPLLNKNASVVFNTSIVHEVGIAGGGPYGATKGALRSLVRALSVELAGDGIRVNSVSPGPIETPIYDKMIPSAAEQEGFTSHMATRIPLGRFGVSADIAAAFGFLLSEESRFITGEELSVDGGLRNNVT